MRGNSEEEITSSSNTENAFGQAQANELKLPGAYLAQVRARRANWRARLEAANEKE
jgi:hypothetical protein